MENMDIYICSLVKTKDDKRVTEGTKLEVIYFETIRNRLIKIVIL